MGIINVDWSQAETSSFEPVEPGNYVATCTNVKLSDKAGPSGSHYLEVEFTGEEPKRKYWTNLSLSPKGLWKLKETLVAMGIEVDDDLQALDTDDMVGVKVTLEVGQEPGYKDPSKIQNVVTAVKAHDGFSWS